MGSGCFHISGEGIACAAFYGEGRSRLCVGFSGDREGLASQVGRTRHNRAAGPGGAVFKAGITQAVAYSVLQLGRGGQLITLATVSGIVFCVLVVLGMAFPILDAHCVAQVVELQDLDIPIVGSKGGLVVGILEI